MTIAESLNRDPDVDPPSGVLIHDPRLEELFVQYPNLRAKLKFIFETATADGHGADNPSILSPRTQKSHPSPAKRVAYAMRILERELNSTAADASGIAAFSNLVAEWNSQKALSE